MSTDSAASAARAESAAVDRTARRGARPDPVVIDPTGADIHGEAARIRARGPVARIELPGGVTAWSITGYDEARQALSDSRFSKDPRKHWTAFVRGEIGMDFPLIGWILMENLTTMHGADHSRLRRLTAGAFTPRRVEKMRESIEKVTAELLDDIDTTPPGQAIDLKARFAHPLPSAVICDLFGIPVERRAEMLHGGEVNVNTTITPEESAANVEKWHQTILDFVDGKRRAMGDDLTSALIAAQDEDGSKLTDNELAGTIHLMLATGTEPVMNLIANAVCALLAHPEQRRLVQSGGVSWQQVIEETLRAEAPVAHLPFRFAVEDIELGGVTIAEGDPVLIGFAGVGRDPAVHGDTAAEFDCTRPDTSHLSFGHGIYRCIGKPLALLEAEIALSSLFRRFPDLTLAVSRAEIKPQETFIMNGVGSLPVLPKPR
ncbi:cytochrome P450 [Actinomadura sp. KC06]|uniref:cytochrome P450 family protein n=1 Tax=Actinomadura sp. KC06 TaxID=2530369 RepID=UPI00104DFE47|nr:cytochrome P450 [Actinomadura sp. KC06]TDD33903.1 cytochrome P450 [Actinomadura sp. KC06]